MLRSGAYLQLNMEPAHEFQDVLDASPFLSAASSSCSIAPRQGFHFTASCNISFSSQHPPHTYALFTLPTTLFVDRYELEQRYIDNNGPHGRVWGEANLELPLASPKLDPRGSAILFTLEGKHREHFDMPLHARYLLPRKDASHEKPLEFIDISAPRIFASDGTCLRSKHFTQVFMPNYLLGIFSSYL